MLTTNFLNLFLAQKRNSFPDVPWRFCSGSCFSCRNRASVTQLLKERPVRGCSRGAIVTLPTFPGQPWLPGDSSAQKRACAGAQRGFQCPAGLLQTEPGRGSAQLGHLGAGGALLGWERAPNSAQLQESSVTIPWSCKKTISP